MLLETPVEALNKDDWPYLKMIFSETTWKNYVLNFCFMGFEKIRRAHVLKIT